MKLIIQIPCLNEEKTLPMTLADLPKHIDGIDVIETQIIDDGSTDKTVAVARQCGVDHIISFRHNQGLATAFKAGAENALKHKADILINTDADNQYCGADIPKLVQPIIEGSADIVVGCRPIKDHPEFSIFKKMLQRLGSFVLRNVSQTTVRDAASGFRAYSKQALLQMNVFSKFSYCMETLIQAGLNNVKIASVDIRVNAKTRESRLFKNIFSYIFRSGKTIVNIYLLYRANVFFLVMSIVTFIASFVLFARYLILVFVYQAASDHFWPTIVLSGILFALAFQILFTGIIASIIASNRTLLEEIQCRLKKMEYGE